MQTSSQMSEKKPLPLGWQSLILSVSLLVIGWLVIAARLDNALILPAPDLVFKRFLSLTADEVFRNSVIGSLRRALTGFGIAVLAATSLGTLAGFFKPVRYFLYPWLQLLRSMPVMSIILYLLLFVPTDWVAVWVSFFIVFPIIYTNVLEGFRSVDTKLLEMASLYGVPWHSQLKSIHAVGVFPYWIAACLTGMGINIKAVITAEAMSLPANSFGLLMAEARNFLDTETLLALTAWIILMAVCLDLLLLAMQWLMNNGKRINNLRKRSNVKAA